MIQKDDFVTTNNTTWGNVLQATITNSSMAFFGSSFRLPKVELANQS
jgi:hypothetical protein